MTKEHEVAGQNAQCTIGENMSEKQASSQKKKKRPKTYQKKLSLYPMTFEQVVDNVLKFKPKSKQK